MNEPTHNDQTNIDQHVLDLLNGSVDGELNTAEKTELDALLTGSARLRDLHAELTAVAGTLDEVPEREFPEYLHHTIVSQVRLPQSARTQDQASGLFSQWLTAPWMRVGLAMAAGVMLTVGIYQAGSENLSPGDTVRMTGTVVKNPAGVLLDSTSFSTGALNGKVELHSENDLLTIKVSLESDGIMLVNLDFSGQDLEYAGVNGVQNQADDIVLADGSISVKSSGTQQYELLLRRTAHLPAEELPGAKLPEGPLNALALEFFADNVLIHKAELNSSR